MPVDVSYEGVVLARGSEVKETPAGLFVALETPMPVGTTLQLSDGSSVRVTRVHEGVGPGVLVVTEGGRGPAIDQIVTPAQVPPPRPSEAIPTPVALAVTKPERATPAPARDETRDEFKATLPAIDPAQVPGRNDKADAPVNDAGEPSDETSGDRNGDPAKRAGRRGGRAKKGK